MQLIFFQTLQLFLYQQYNFSVTVSTFKHKIFDTISPSLPHIQNIHVVYHSKDKIKNMFLMNNWSQIPFTNVDKYWL